MGEMGEGQVSGRGYTESLKGQNVGRESAPEARPPSRVDWDKGAAAYDAFTMLELEDTARYLDEAGVRAGDTLLDVCCGSGRVALMAARRGAQALGIDSSEGMLALARSHAQRMGLSDAAFRLMDWGDVVPGENVAKHDVVFASRCNAMVEIEKLSALANRTVVAQFFADAPPIPALQARLFEGCGEGARGDKAGRAQVVARCHTGAATSTVRTTFTQLADKVHEAGYLPNVRVLPERFRAVFATADEALTWACAIRPERALGHEDRVRTNLAPFLRKVQGGVEFRMATRAALVWWNVSE